jgi:uncharacterized protein (DUF488 family)
LSLLKYWYEVHQDQEYRVEGPNAGTSAPKPAIYTLGHSTRPPDEFAAILSAFEIRTVADIRTVPRSRRNPQYDQETFSRWLRDHSVEYVHIRELGGLRKPRKDSVNTAWKNDSFRGYADYMQTEAFEEALERLISLLARQRTAIVCAEAVPWRCHRSLVGDALLVRNVSVIDIMSSTKAKRHALTPWARIDGWQITYPAPLEAHAGLDRR